MPSQHSKELWARIPDDEPVFILRAQDLLADGAVRRWLADAESAGVNEDKRRRAREHYTAILEFQQDHPERCKIPD